MRIRWQGAAKAALYFVIFVAIFLAAFVVSMPGEAIVPRLRALLEKSGYDLSTARAELSFPAKLTMTGVDLSRKGSSDQPLHFDTVTASPDIAGFLRGMPLALRLAKGEATATLLMSPFTSPSRKGSLSISGFSSETLLPPSPEKSGFSFTVSEGSIRWKDDGGKAAGTGSARLSSLVIPISDPASPVREARIVDARLALALRGDTLVVSSITGKYEGSDVEGTGEISGIGSNAGARLTFHIKVRNPYQGRVADLFQMMAKNAKNATLRIGGSLESPKGEMQIF